MFGYIRPEAGELLVKDFEFYKSVYCGLCRVGGKRISHLTRFLLNYDFVFLAVVRMAVTGENVCASLKRCPYRIKKKCMTDENASLIYTSAVFGILTHYKTADDLHDSPWYKKPLYFMPYIFTKRMRKRGAELWDGLDTEIKVHLDRLSELEKSNCAVPDEAAHEFASVTAICASGGVTGEKREILEKCGYHIGRYIYLLDALADSADDAKSGNFNVLNNRYGGNINTDEVVSTLKDSITEFSESYKLNGQTQFDMLVYNIAILGAKNAVNKVIENNGNGKKK